MYAVGVDLAWGRRSPSGLAVLDEGGALVHVSAQRTDEDIDAALAPYLVGPCVVAIDAPLVVTNDTGNRPAEAALNRDFARFDAGAHPSNRGSPSSRACRAGPLWPGGSTSTWIPSRPVRGVPSRSTRTPPRSRSSGSGGR